jgi:hypothetical protein
MPDPGRTINHIPREPMPSEVRELLNFLEDLRFLGDPNRATDLEARRRTSTHTSHEPPIGDIASQARREYDRIRIMLDRQVREGRHRFWCDKSLIQPWDEFCPGCNKRLRARVRASGSAARPTGTEGLSHPL